jgi:murein tripeptide amidase MpaA
VDVQSQVQNELKKHYGDQPAILLTGQHHAREHITASVVLFSLLKLLHGGVVWRSQEYVDLLLQNKYYVIPSVNVDGVAFIEAEFLKTGQLPEKRKNMNIQSKECPAAEAGVDLNRNYDFLWGVGDTANDKECEGETYGGKAPFSEPETRAIRDFVAAKKNELRFVYNLHCSGNQYIIPFNGVNPNNADVL